MSAAVPTKTKPARWARSFDSDTLPQRACTKGSIPLQSAAGAVVRRLLAAPRAIAAAALAAAIALSLSSAPAIAQEEKEIKVPPLSAQVRATAKLKGMDPHAKIFQEDQYPTAAVCGTCHAQIYKEWRHRATPTRRSRRCSTSSSRPSTICRPARSAASASAATRPSARNAASRAGSRCGSAARLSREGVTCVTCHRITEEYGKVNGERR